MNKTRLFMLLVVMLLSVAFVGIALAADSAQKPNPPEQVAFTGLPPEEKAGVNSLSGSFVAFDPSVGGDSCFIPGNTQTFCFRAENFTNDWEYVYNLWEKFPTDWTVNNVYVLDTPAPFCTGGGTWGTFGWSFQTAPYEVNIAHGRYDAYTDHCIAYYCFEVVAGTGAPDALESWYWAGDGYNSVPHHPCSNDNYTPAGQDTCDEAVNPQAAIPACALEPGVFLNPAELNASGCNGLPQVHTFSLFNNTGADGVFDMTYNAPAGMATLTGPDPIPVPNGVTVPFDVILEPNVCNFDTIVASIDAAGNGYADTSIITKTISDVPSWETVPASAPSWAGTGYPRDGCTARNATGEWVTYLFGDTSSIFGFWGYNLSTNTWFQPDAANTPADRWAPDWAYDSETNQCYVTGGGNTPGGGTYTESYRYDPIANAFVSLGSFTSARDFHNSWVGTIDSVKYLCIGGGVNASSALIQATQCYDLSQGAPGAWNAENAQMAVLPTDPFGAADGILHAPTGDQFWYIGGAINAFATVTDEARYWDDADNSWHFAGNTGFPRYRVEGDFFGGDYYQVGGSSGGFTPTTDVVQGHFDGANWVWTLLDNLLNTRMDNVVGVNDVSVWSVDGYGGSSPDYVEHAVFCPLCAVPDIEVTPISLQAEQAPDTVTTQQLQICNVGDAPLDWSLTEVPTLKNLSNHPMVTLPSKADVNNTQSENVTPFEGVVTQVGTGLHGSAGSSDFGNPDALLWDNGPLVTYPADCSGMDASRLQTDLIMNTLGFGHQFSLGYRMADDFTITDPGGWQIDQFTLFAYQTGAPTSPAPIAGVYYQIWDGPPDDPGSSVVFGDLTTNRLLSSTNPNMQRDTGTSPCANNRYIFADVVSAGTTLPPGTYWIDWMTDGNVSYSGPWAPPSTILGQTTTGNAIQYTGAWAPALDTGTATQQGMPFIIEGEVIGGGNPANVLLLNADGDNDGYSPIQVMLQAYGDLSSVDLYDVRSATPTLAELQAYDVVVTWSNYAYLDATALGDVLADYVDTGGKVINLNFSMIPYAGYALAGRFVDENYVAMWGTGFASSSVFCLGSFDPAHPIMTGITDVCEYYLETGTYLTPGSSEVARWANNELFVAVKDNQTAVSINGYVGLSYVWTGQMPDVLHNAILWLTGGITPPSNIPWLSEIPTSGTVNPSACIFVEVSFDSTGLTLGTYTGELDVNSNDPEEPVVPVDVTLNVLLAPPDISVNPNFLISTLLPNSQETQDLNVCNVGDAPLDWTVSEIPANLLKPVKTTPVESIHSITIGDLSYSTNQNTKVQPMGSPIRLNKALDAVTITHSVSQEIMSGNSVSCNGGGGHTDNSYLRVFTLSDFGINSDFTITNVEIGIETAVAGGGGNQPATVNLYTLEGPLLWANLTLIGSAPVVVTDQALTIINMPVNGVALAGSTLVVEFFTPNGQLDGNLLFVGSNNLGQTGLTYLAAVDCGVAEPTDTADIGFPGMHLVMNVTGEVVNADIPWLSETPTSGTVLPGECAVINVTFDSTGLDVLVYHGGLDITSNDPDTPVFNVPVTLSVNAPDITLNAPPFETTLHPGEVDALNMYIGNIGNWNLTWAVTDGATWLNENPESGTVSPNTETQVVVFFDSMGLTPGVYTTSVVITSDDPDQPEITLPATLTVIPFESDLSVVKTVSADVVKVGDVFTYTLVLANDGPDIATGVMLVDTLPDLVMFKSASGGCTELEGVVTCLIGDLAMGDSVTITITVTAASDGIAGNTAVVSSDNVDPNPEDNTATVDTVILPAFYYFYLPITQKH